MNNSIAEVNDDESVDRFWVAKQSLDFVRFLMDNTHFLVYLPAKYVYLLNHIIWGLS